MSDSIEVSFSVEIFDYAKDNLEPAVREALRLIQDPNETTHAATVTFPYGDRVVDLDKIDGRA